MCYKFKIYFISPAHNFKLDKPTLNMAIFDKKYKIINNVFPFLSHDDYRTIYYLFYSSATET